MSGSESQLPGAECRPPFGGIRMLWEPSLWAVPFALFFWLLFSSWTAGGLWRTYLISAVFTYITAVFMWALHRFVLPRLGRPRYHGGTRPFVVEIAAYMTAALLGGFIAAAIVHAFLLPGFLGSARSALIVGSYLLLFSALFTGAAYALAFYRESIERSRNVETARSELARAELTALRAQIDPHFLFNTLNAIASLIPSDPAAAEDMTTRLAEVFRHTLRTSDRATVPLAEEIAFAEDYLAIERMRFGERLRVRFEIDEAVRTAPVPSLLLQPLIENAVRHAVAARPEGGAIEVRAMPAGGGVEIEVLDDGPGFDPEAPPAGTGFGLRSVRERVRALGGGAAVTVDTAPGRGTRVRVHLSRGQA